MPLASRLATLCLFIGASVAFGQSTTQEDLGVITAPALSGGLGWQVSAGNEQEFVAASAAGATHVRLDSCVWEYVEQQSAPPNNISSGYTLPSGCAAGLNLSRKYGLKPTLIAAYGSPFHQILTVKLLSTAAVGSTSLSVEYVSGVGGNNLSSINYPYAYVTDVNGNRLSKKYSYPGDLITSSTLTSGSSATIKLASALTTALGSGTTMYINEVLYPSAVTGSPTDPSNIAFAKYAEYLAEQIKAYGLTGDVELWNEPPWNGDCWDNRRDCYDTDPGFPGELQGNGSNYGLAAALQTTTPVDGVSYVWGGTNKSGSADLLGGNMLKYTGKSFIQPQAAVTLESMHPYGSNPEDAMWLEPCVQANPKKPQACNTIVPLNSNYVNTEAADIIARQGGSANGITHAITETGAVSLYEDPAHLARFVTRQFLGFMADHFNYVDFYRLYDTTIPGQAGFSFITLTENRTSYNTLPHYDALAGIMSDVSEIQAAPATAYSASDLPAVTGYAGGTYNLDHLAIVGSRPGDSKNSIMYTLWQRSYVAQPCGYSLPCWGTVPQPTEALTTVSIPSGLKIEQVVNLDTRANVPFTQSGSSASLYVSDDPIEIMFIPTGDSSASAGLKTPKLQFVQIADQIQGASVTVSASSASKGAITYTVASGSATVSGRTVTATGPGTVVIQASQAATSTYKATTATTSFNVTATTPSLKFGTITPRTFGDVFGVVANSLSKGAVTYSIVSGPGTLSGSTVTTTGAGTIVIEADQAVYGQYTAATAALSVSVSPKAPTFTFNTVGDQTYGNTATLNTTSNSNGAVTYSVTGGPATISGNTVSFTTIGQVYLKATIAANGGYTAGTATTQFHVNAATPTLVLSSVPATPYDTAISLDASSPSNGKIIYTIVSGPARINGSTVTTLSSDGTVVVKASQVVSGPYNSATTTTSFPVKSSVSPVITLPSISTKTVGSTFSVSASSTSPAAITYVVTSGNAVISGSTVTVTDGGTITIKAVQAATGGYTAGSASTSVAVAVTALAFKAIPSKNTGDVFTVSATSASPGAITYSVVSGPATVSGSTVTVTGMGTIVLQAKQAASGNYPSATATTSFSGMGVAPTLAFVPISPKTFGDVLGVLANSNSTGNITYSVDSGPAVISGRTVTMNGSGTVVLKATQEASDKYSASSTTISFPVAADPHPLTFTPIAPKTKGDVLVVSANATSPGAITYSVASGPATMSGATVSMTGGGTVTLMANQAASGVWPAASTTISFPVASK